MLQTIRTTFGYVQEGASDVRLRPDLDGARTDPDYLEKISKAVVAAGAQADTTPPASSSDPAQVVNQAAGQPALDNDVTPYAKPDSTTWKQVAGAPYPSQTVIPGSVTPYTADLSAVAFQDQADGFAGGSDEIDCGAGKERVPVLYQYSSIGGANPSWHQSWHGDCQSGPGWGSRRTAAARGGPAAGRRTRRSAPAAAG